MRRFEKAVLPRDGVGDVEQPHSQGRTAMHDVTTNDHGMKAAFKIDEARVRGHVDQLVRQSVEQTLNGL